MVLSRVDKDTTGFGLRSLSALTICSVAALLNQIQGSFSRVVLIISG